MIPLFKHFWNALINDEMAAKRWLRAALMAMAASGMTWADQLADILKTPVKSLRIAAVVCMALSVMINLGEKNAKEGNDVPPLDIHRP